MALMDDKSFLISHIRNSFITSDDTGMCELIIEPDEMSDRRHSGVEKRPTTWHGSRSGDGSSLSDSGLESDTELAHSYDILPDMDFASHRRRSNTQQRLEKLKRDKHKQSKIKHIPWKESEYSVNEIGEYFEKKTVTPKPSKEGKSCLSKQLEQFAAAPDNPFLDYAKFNGMASAGIPTKKIQIFLTMLTPDERPFPMTVVTLATAKVQDLVGLICWQYVSESKQPNLKENIESYALHIAEDDGEVDMDFPALDLKEPISKFGFTKLALVEREPPKRRKTSKVVTINMPDRGFSRIPVDIDDMPMRDFLEKVVVRRKFRQVKGLEYGLEKQNEPGTVIDLDAPLSAMDTLDFCLVRENSIRGDTLDRQEPHHNMSEMAESLSSHQYKSYIVQLSHKLTKWTNTEVQLGISGEKVEIDPKSSKSLIFKQKAVSYPMEDIAECLLLEEKSSGKAIFRLVYHASHDFKHHDFECDTSTAREIVQKVKNIMEMRSSPVRKDYLAHKEKKHRRHTLGF